MFRSKTTESATEFLAPVNNILNDLYKAAPPVPGLVDSALTMLNLVAEAKMTEEQKTVRENALRALRVLLPNYNAELAADNILDAHKGLIEACINGEEIPVQAAIISINKLGVLPGIKLAIISAKASCDTDANETARLCALGYSTLKTNLKIIKLLLSRHAYTGTTENTTACPILFRTVISPNAWKSNNLVPYATMRGIIEAYLHAKFDIATLFDKKNILQFAIENKKQPHYSHHLLEQQIAAHVEKQLIDRKQFKEFYSQFKREELKEFYHIAKQVTLDHEEKPIYANPNEAKYYQLKSFTHRLRDYCIYEKTRLESKTVTDFFSSTKSERFGEIIENLNKILRNSFGQNYQTGAYEKATLALEISLDAIHKNSIRLRAGGEISNLLFPKTPLSETNWKIFCEDNQEDIDLIKGNMRNELRMLEVNVR